VAAAVRLTLVPLDHPLAAVHGEYNAVMVQGSPAGDLMFYGKGAGAGPAASAVVGDVLKLARDLAKRPGAAPSAGGRGSRARTPGLATRGISALSDDLLALGESHRDSPAADASRAAAARPPRRPAVILPPGQGRSAFYLRLDVADRPGVLSRITGALGSRGVSIARIYQEEPRAASRGAAPRAPVFIATHPAAEASMEAARRDILRLPFVSPSHACLRML
jgi:homoserine dehydrogenase